MLSYNIPGAVMLKKILLLMALSFPAWAEEPSTEAPKNFCLDPKAAQNNEKLARENPRDETLIKLVAMRAGLCDLLEKKIIDLDFAIDLFNGEHAHGIQKRIEEEQTSKQEVGA
jgi:hypothetical protein